MKDILRPLLELTVVFPGLLLAYFPVRSYLKQSPARLAAWAVPLLLGLCLGGGLLCYHFCLSTAFPLLLITLAAIFLYLKTLRVSLWKSGTIALAVCAVFACLNSLSRAVGAAITIRLQLPSDKPWFCFSACIFYNMVCWLTAAAAYYPATHAVRTMVEDENFAQTWYVFWVLPLVFILLNLFMIPRYQITLRTGRVLQVYIVMSIALLFLMFLFNAIFLLMANSLNRNARLQQENQFLSMQQQRYESLKAAIEEVRQARHDMRHQLNQISALAEAGYPATHAVRTMVEDENFAQTWYVFWVLPLVFILLNLFMIPRYQITLRTGRVLQVYIVMSIALLFLMFLFNAIFLLMANSLNRNARLQQENQFLSMQQQRYESLKAAIEEVRQARHDMRHQLNQISALAEAGDLDGLKAYLAKTVSRIPNLDMSFCENRAADSVVGYYCTLAKREGIPFRAKLDLPQALPVDEIDTCLVLSNLLENAFEASLHTAPARRQIRITAYVHAERLLLVEVENAFDGEVNEKSGVFRSSKRKENGIGIQSVQHIAEKTGGASTFTYQDGVFSAKVMLCG